MFYEYRDVKINSLWITRRCSNPATCRVLRRCGMCADLRDILKQYAGSDDPEVYASLIKFEQAIKKAADKKSTAKKGWFG